MVVKDDDGPILGYAAAAIALLILLVA